MKKNHMKKLFGGLAFGVVMFAAGVALADRTVTLVTAQARVTTITFRSNDNGATIKARVCGNTRDGSSNILPTSCYDEVLAAGAFKTSITALFTGGALTFWRGKENI